MNSNEMLQILNPFQNNKKVLVYNQGVGDIIKAILKQHDDMTGQYDLIYNYFAGENIKSTAKNVWNYLKKNVTYNIEPDDKQMIKTPAAIIATGKSGSDCKNYALFAAGILDAYRRNTGDFFTLCYRFASYDDWDKTPQHVFVVINPDTNNEIWCDPVLDEFNLKTEPNYYKDKIINMSLQSLSGTTNYKKSLSGGDLSSFVGTGVTTATAAAQGFLNPISDLAAVSSLFGSLTSLFGGGHSKQYYFNQAREHNIAAAPQAFTELVQVTQGSISQDAIDKTVKGIADSGASEDRDGIQQFPQIFLQTKAPIIAQAYVSAVKQNLLQKNPDVEAILFPPPPTPVVTNPVTSLTSTGTNNILLIAGIGLAAFLILKK